MAKLLSKDEGPDPRVMAKRVITWLQSPEGQEELRKSNERCEEIVKMFRKARDISWERLHAPFTI
jgi:hypothetical protein